MAGIRKFEIRVGLALLIYALLSGGCDSVRGFLGGSGAGRASRIDEVTRTLADEKKAKLLKQIDRKFESPEAHFELGKLYQGDGLWTRAEHEYNIALSFDPAHRRAQAAMVKVLIDSGNTDKAELYADIYMNQVASSASGSLRLALAFQKEELDEYALGCYWQALHLAPNSAKINRQIGYYYLSKNEKGQAREYLGRSFQLDPTQPEVGGQLGRLGVAIKVPRKPPGDTRKLDKIVERSDSDRQAGP